MDVLKNFREFLHREQLVESYRNDEWLNPNIPGSDRTVRLDDNQTEYDQIGDNLDYIAEQIRGDNELEEDVRLRLTSLAESVRYLWRSAELSYLQLKVGVIMNLEKIVPYVAEKTISAIITETIKRIIVMAHIM